MAFRFVQCRDLVLKGILAAIRASAEELASIAKEPAAVTGISLDIVPWHRAIGLSIRQATEHGRDIRYCNVEWANFDVVSNDSCVELQDAIDFVHEAYTSENSNHLAREMAHLIFLAGAEALLDAQVAVALSELGINAPVCGADFMPLPFEYMVFDFDGTVPGNYCHLVLANRVTARWWPKLS